jgi:hypothetical protein
MRMETTSLSNGAHYTERQESYGKDLLRKPIAGEKAIAIGFCSLNCWALDLFATPCINVRLRNAFSSS